MSYSLADYFAVLAPRLPPALCDGAATAQLRAVAAKLPPSSLFGFETRLADASPVIDLMTAIAGDDGSRRAHAGRNPLAAVPQPFLDDAAWRGLTAFCRRWDDGEPPFAAIQDLWLELDAAVLRRASPTPCVFFHLRAGVGDGASVAREACRVLFGDAAFELSDATRRCFDGAHRVDQVALMLSRPQVPVRLVLTQLRFDDVVAILKRLRWSGDVARLEHHHRRIAVFAQPSLSLAIDLGERLHDKVGIEYCPPRNATFRAGFARLLERCVELGLALHEKARTLSEWDGFVRASASTEPWPRSLRLAQERLRRESAFRLGLSHVKLVFDGDATPQLKAYFGFEHVWLPCTVGDGIAAHR